MDIGSFDPVDFIWSLLKTALWGLVAIAIIVMIYTLFSILFAAIKKKYSNNGK